MEKWITRSAAALVAAGSIALFWTFGVFVAVPWRESRMLSLNAVELQVLGIPLLAGLLVAWGALHLLAIADRADSPRLYHTLRVAAPDRSGAGGPKAAPPGPTNGPVRCNRRQRHAPLRKRVAHARPRSAARASEHPSIPESQPERCGRDRIGRSSIHPTRISS
jgi:hypothetical protein